MHFQRISIFNYEAFYLDHLEGNLGEKAIDLNLRPVSADIFKKDATADAEMKVYKTANPQGEDLAMENPIEPVTNFISDKAKTEVEFKRRKAEGKKKGGFFLKIGKFEFSKNKH